jgi:hypothetical protein
MSEWISGLDVKTVSNAFSIVVFIYSIGLVEIKKDYQKGTFFMALAIWISFR